MKENPQISQMTQIFSLRSLRPPRFYFRRRRHERRLNTMNENPQISPMTQIFLCTFAPLRLCVKLFSKEKRQFTIRHGHDRRRPGEARGRMGVNGRIR